MRRIGRSFGAETTGLQGGRGGAGRDGSPAPSGRQVSGGKSGPVCQSYAVFFSASRDGEAIRGACRCRARGLPRGRRAAAGRWRRGGASRGPHDPAAQVVPSGPLGRNQLRDVAKSSALRSEWPECLEFRPGTEWLRDCIFQLSSLSSCFHLRKAEKKMTLS